MADSISLDIINEVFDLFQTNSNTLIDRLQPTCLKVIFSLMVIDLTIDLLFDQGDENIFLILIRKVMFYGLFITVIQQYKVIVNDYILKGFIQLGNYLSLGKFGTSFEISPTQILANFFEWTTPFWSVGSLLMVTVDGLGIESIPTGICLLILWSACLYFIITCTVTMAFVRFFIVTGCALIIVPFAVFKETSSIGKGILQIFLKQGAKIMLMVMILNYMGDKTSFSGNLNFTNLSAVILHGMIWLAIINEVPTLVEEIFGGHLGGGFLRGNQGFGSFAGRQTGQVLNQVSRGNNLSFKQNASLAIRSLFKK